MQSYADLSKRPRLIESNHKCMNPKSFINKDGSWGTGFVSFKKHRQFWTVCSIHHHLEHSIWSYKVDMIDIIHIISISAHSKTSINPIKLPPNPTKFKFHRSRSFFLSYSESGHFRANFHISQLILLDVQQLLDPTILRIKTGKILIILSRMSPQFEFITLRHLNLQLVLFDITARPT